MIGIKRNNMTLVDVYWSILIRKNITLEITLEIHILNNN